MGKNKYGHTGGWSATGKMRNNGQSAQAHLQVNFLEKDTNPNPSKNYTVQFSVGPAYDAVTGLLRVGVPVNPIAEIKWSVEGNDVRRVVSVVSGMSLTGVGEAIKVSVLDKSTQVQPGGVTPYDPVIYDVDITCAPGSRASVTQPPTLTAQNPSDLTYSFITGPGPGQVFVEVPNDSGIISAYVTAFSEANILTDADVSVTQINGSLLNRQYGVTRPEWVPLVAGTQKLLLKNNSAHTVLWAVTFGIDG